MPAITLQRHHLAAAAAALILGVPEGSVAIDFGIPSLFKRNREGLETAGQAPEGPGALAITPSGDYIVSCHQFFDPDYAVVRLNRDGAWEPFPNLAMNTPSPGNPLALDAVLGLACDPDGVVWMLDNGRRSETPAKLVGWNTAKGRAGELHQAIYLPAPATLKTSFPRNLALDPSAPYIYITDPAAGQDAALIVVDLSTGLPRRVLQGHYSVQPDPKVVIHLDGRAVEARSADGRTVHPLAGAGPIAVDRKGQWLYFGPVQGGTLYRVQTEFLRDASLDSQQLAAKVQAFSVKPVCESIAVDTRGNVYFGDIAANAIGYVTPEEKYLQYFHLVQDGRLIWPGGLTFGADGKLHFFSNQLHRTPIYNSGKDVTAPPFEIFRAKPVPGRGLWPR